MRRRAVRLAAIAVLAIVAAGSAMWGWYRWASGSMDIYLLAGQSNMSGRDRVELLPSGFPAHGDRILVFSNAWTWQAGYAPVDNPAGQLDRVSLDLQAGVGPGLSFAESLVEADPNRLVGLVPCARGGSSIEQWQRPTRPDDRATLYGSCLTRARSAAEIGRVRGLLFYQGERDTASSADADAWPGQFLRFVEDFRADLAEPSLRVVFAQIATISDAARARRVDGYAAWNVLKDRQSEVSHRGIAMVRTEDLDMMPDGVHVSARGQLELGRRFAEALDTLR